MSLDLKSPFEQFIQQAFKGHKQPKGAIRRARKAWYSQNRVGGEDGNLGRYDCSISDREDGGLDLSFYISRAGDGTLVQRDVSLVPYEIEVVCRQDGDSSESKRTLVEYRLQGDYGHALGNIAFQEILGSRKFQQTRCSGTDIGVFTDFVCQRVEDAYVRGEIPQPIPLKDYDPRGLLPPKVPVEENPWVKAAITGREEGNEGPCILRTKEPVPRVPLETTTRDLPSIPAPVCSFDQPKRARGLSQFL